MSVPLKVTVTGNFLDRMLERIKLWEGQKISATLVADETAKWWYWQEHGTAGQGDHKGASYPIVPVNATALRFPGKDGKEVVVDRVEHHGIKARRIVSKVMPDIKREADANVALAFAQGAMDSPQVLQDAIVEACDVARTLIMESIDLNLTGKRPDGKLQGQSPSSVFESGTKVVNNSGGS